MPFRKLLGRSAVALACWGTVAQPVELFAADAPSKAKPAVKTAAKASVSDVSLTKKGALVGQVVDGQGKPLDGAAVSLRQGPKEIATAVTDEKGKFSIPNVRGGVYQITAGDGAGTYRVWTANAAPPSAREQALVVSKPEVVRGQTGGVSSTTALATTGVVLGAVGAGLGSYAVVKTQDQEDKINSSNSTIRDLQNQLNALQASPP